MSLVSLVIGIIGISFTIYLLINMPIYRNISPMTIILSYSVAAILPIFGTYLGLNLLTKKTKGENKKMAGIGVGLCLLVYVIFVYAFLSNIAGLKGY